MSRPDPLTAAMAPLVAMLATMVLEEVRKGRPEADEWLPHHRSPLGRRKARELCMRGTFQGARKVGRTWMIRRTEHDAYIEAQTRKNLPPANANEWNGGGVDAVLAEVGLQSRRRGR